MADRYPTWSPGMPYPANVTPSGPVNYDHFVPASTGYGLFGSPPQDIYSRGTVNGVSVPEFLTVGQLGQALGLSAMPPPPPNTLDRIDVLPNAASTPSLPQPTFLSTLRGAADDAIGNAAGWLGDRFGSQAYRDELTARSQERNPVLSPPNFTTIPAAALAAAQAIADRGRSIDPEIAREYPQAPQPTALPPVPTRMAEDDGGARRVPTQAITPEELLAVRPQDRPVGRAATPQEIEAARVAVRAGGSRSGGGRAALRGPTAEEIAAAKATLRASAPRSARVAPPPPVPRGRAIAPPPPPQRGRPILDALLGRRGGVPVARPPSLLRTAIAAPARVASPPAAIPGGVGVVNGGNAGGFGVTGYQATNPANPYAGAPAVEYGFGLFR